MDENMWLCNMGKLLSILILIVGFLLGVFFTDYYFREEWNKRIDIMNEYLETYDCPKIECETKQIDMIKCPEYEKYLFLEIAKNISNSHEYIRDVYDCSEFSHDLTMKLREAGYKAHTHIGQYKGGSHAWVVVDVPIEATGGYIIPHHIYEEDYR